MKEGKWVQNMELQRRKSVIWNQCWTISDIMWCNECRGRFENSTDVVHLQMNRSNSQAIQKEKKLKHN